MAGEKYLSTVLGIESSFKDFSKTLSKIDDIKLLTEAAVNAGFSTKLRDTIMDRIKEIGSNLDDLEFLISIWERLKPGQKVRHLIEGVIYEVCQTHPESIDEVNDETLMSLCYCLHSLISHDEKDPVREKIESTFREKISKAGNLENLVKFQLILPANQNKIGKQLQDVLREEFKKVIKEISKKDEPEWFSLRYSVFLPNFVTRAIEESQNFDL